MFAEVMAEADFINNFYYHAPTLGWGRG